MNRSLLVWHAVSCILILILASWWFQQENVGDSSLAYPNRPIRVIVPYAAGGGSDTFVRIMEQGLQAAKGLTEPIVIINQAGGIGTIGSREVKNAPPDGYKILCHHNAIITAKLAGTVDYGPEAFEPIALTGEMSMVVLVRADSRIENLRQLLEAAQAQPKSIRFAANKGAPAYFSALQLERCVPGAELTIVSSGGGADRYSKIIGGHLDAGIFSLSEYLDFRGVTGTPPERDIRAIAVLSPQRHESIPEIPTASELGIPVVLRNANYWWAPKGTPREVLTSLASALEVAMQQPKVLEELNRLRLDPTFATGEPLRQKLDSTVKGFEAVAESKAVSLPPFTLYVGLILVFLLICSFADSHWSGQQSLVEKENSGSELVASHYGLAVGAFLLLMLYVSALQMAWMPLALAASCLVFALGSAMSRHTPCSKIVLLELALLTGFGIQFVFTELFAIALPT